MTSATTRPVHNRTPRRTKVATKQSAISRARKSKSASGSRKMTASHKSALARGRRESRAIALYLEALNSAKRRPGRKRTPTSIDERLAAISGLLPTSSQLQQLELIQERMNLEAEKAQLGSRGDISGLEKEFVKCARDFADRRGITYSAFRAKAVPAAVLARAGIKRTRS